jgi:hypothetical protein
MESDVLWASIKLSKWKREYVTQEYFIKPIIFQFVL